MYKDLGTKLLKQTDRILVDDYDLPTIVPVFYEITGKTSPVVDFRANMIFKVSQFDDLCDKTFGKVDRKLVFESIENSRLHRMFVIKDTVFSIIYSLGDTDKARELRTVMGEGAPLELVDDGVNDPYLVEVEDNKKLSAKRSEFKYIVSLVIVYPQENGEMMEEFLNAYDQHKYERIKTVTQDSIFTIGSNQSGLTLLRHKMDTSKYTKDIIESNYNDDFIPAYDKLVKFLESKNESGLVLLKGKPGTGKSSLLLHLTTLAKELDVKFVFVPSSFTNVLSEPSFLTFAVGQLKNSVLILEDAEDALVARGTGMNSAVTNVLNIADGILGKILNLKLLTTVNREESMDEALRRKGRLKLDYNFDLLKKDKANKLLNKLGINRTVDKDMSLADLYNIEEDPNVGESKTIRKPMGFRAR